MTRKLLILAGGLAAVYLLTCAGLFAAMIQPPDRFGRIMKHVPWPAFVVLPFESLWGIARGGGLDAGDPAPDFELETADGSARVRLSSFRGQRPVVLVFGSYT
jgi:hypothetical protein